MADTRVLKFERSDSKSAYVLVQATPKGSKPLDLKLVATEGEGIFVATLKNDRVNSLRVKNCPVSEEEWHSILLSIFAQEPLPDIDATATVESESLLSLTIRKRLQGITQRLGSIDLKHDYREIELFEWCATAADAAAKNKEAHAALESRIREQDSIVAELKAQLDELLRAKEEDETALLRNVRDLINEKKVKIREYHKILETTRLSNDSPLISQSQSRPESITRQSRPGKRKADATEGLNDDDNMIQDMEVDDIKSEPDRTDSGQITDATASVADDSNEDEDEDASISGARDSPQPAPPKKAVHEPPPRRDLPFINKKSAKPPPSLARGGSETESDDEL